jgi:hypothetical protein
VEQLMAVHRDNPLTPQAAPALAPLVNSQEFDPLEAELKALFIQQFETFIRPTERAINTSGMPHLGPFSQVEQAVKAEGLALVRRTNADEAAMRYVFKAWRAGNPKRGLHMLRIYLQMLWPNGWVVEQMWQDKAQPYPTALVNHDAGNHYLTSRVAVTISGVASDGSDVAIVTPALRSVMPARLLLQVTVAQVLSSEIGMATILHSLTSYRSFTGSCI